MHPSAVPGIELPDNFVSEPSLASRLASARRKALRKD